MMLTESCAAAVESSGNGKATNSNLKDASVIFHQVHPEPSLRQVFKKGSVPINGLAVSKTHVFAVQADKAAVNVYSRAENKQEASVFFPAKVTSIAIQDVESTNFVILGLANGGLVIWETSNGRTVFTNCFHTQPVTTVRLHENSNLIVSGSDDTNVQVWDLARLLYFSAPADQNIRDPLRAFTQHRTPIADVIFNRGQSFSVVAISASKDGICHIWDPTTLELSRTILLNTVPRCLVLDPADRVLYIGSGDGSIASIDFIKTFIPLSNGKTNQAMGPTVQEQSFPFAQLENAGAVHCLTISFDSTVLLSGHEDGKIHAWDAGKGKYKQLIVDLSQPVTNLLMLHPEGLNRTPTSNITVPTIIKPKPAETYSSATPNNIGTSGLPSSYTIHVQLTGAREPSMPSAEYETRLRNPGFFTPGPFPRSLIDEGLAEFAHDTTQTPDDPPSKPAAPPPAEPISPVDIATEVSAQGRIRWLSRELASRSSELEIANKALARYDARWKAKRVEYLEREEAIRRQLLTAEVDVTVPSSERDALVAKVEREVEELKSEIFGDE